MCVEQTVLRGVKAGNQCQQQLQKDHQTMNCCMTLIWMTTTSVGSTDSGSDTSHKSCLLDKPQTDKPVVFWLVVVPVVGQEENFQTVTLC